jgi:hypothetical protein
MPVWYVLSIKVVLKVQKGTLQAGALVDLLLRGPHFPRKSLLAFSE